MDEDDYPLGEYPPLEYLSEVAESAVKLVWELVSRHIFGGLKWPFT